MEKIRKLFIITAIILAISGCAAANVDQQKAQSYSNDGYLGLTNTNPNLPTNPSYHTYDVDTKMIHEAAIKVQGVKDTRITLGNANANVLLFLEEGISGEQARRIQAEAFQQITYAMPRYTVNVSLANNF